MKKSNVKHLSHTLCGLSDVIERTDKPTTQLELLRLLQHSPYLHASGAPTIDPLRHLMQFDAAQIEAITRRDFIIGTGGLVMGTALTGCKLVGETDAPASSAMRTVTDVRGEVEIPANPQRVITLDAQSFETAIDLGIPVVATVTIFDETWPHLGPNVLEGRDTIGAIVNPNLEAIALANPDLIVGLDSLYGEGGRNSIVDELSTIAPTVIYAQSPNIGGGWREYYLKLADVYNQLTLAEERLAVYEQRVQAFREAFGDKRLNSFLISLIDIRTDFVLLRGIDQVLGGTVMRDVGLQRPENQQLQNMLQISLEELPAADADAIIVLNSDADALEQIEESAIWQSLNAVRDNQVYRAPRGGNHWLVGTLPAALAVLEDLFVFFVTDEE